VKYLSLYLLMGAMTAVWSAINNRSEPVAEPALAPRVRLVSMAAAYGLVALLWPLSLALSAYALFLGLTSREGPERGR
jgi:hypothetical protein